MNHKDVKCSVTGKRLKAEQVYNNADEVFSWLYCVCHNLPVSSVDDRAYEELYLEDD
jgi:hypothetical protein